MPGQFQPDFWSLLAAFLVSVISGFISIVQRIARGQRATWIWVVSEFMAAILCGYIIYDLYPLIKGDIPKWMTLPLLVAVAAHMGGRSFQLVENAIHKRYPVVLDPLYKDPKDIL